MRPRFSKGHGGSNVRFDWGRKRDALQEDIIPRDAVLQIALGVFLPVLSRLLREDNDLPFFVGEIQPVPVAWVAHHHLWLGSPGSQIKELTGWFAAILGQWRVVGCVGFAKESARFELFAAEELTLESLLGLSLLRLDGRFGTGKLPSMKNPGNLFLVGPMGAGKSTIGRQLARALRVQFLDSDHVIEQRTGANIPLIFELEGEAGFRAREKAVIDELTQLQDIVLATGGGAVLDPENRARLAARGRVIYLRTSVDQQLARTARDRNRPLLQTENPRARLEELLRVRDPLYREIADLTVNTNGRRVSSVVREILQRLGCRRPGRKGKQAAP